MANSLRSCCSLSVRCVFWCFLWCVLLKFESLIYNSLWEVFLCLQIVLIVYDSAYRGDAHIQIHVNPHKNKKKVIFQSNYPTNGISPSVSAFLKSCMFVSAWCCRSSREAPADLPHLPSPAACWQPTSCKSCRHHTGPLQETVHAERRSRSEDNHESCGAGMAEKYRSLLQLQ